MILKNSIGLKGYVNVSVIDHEGRTVRELPRVRNLWVDQGLDRLAEVVLADAFRVAIKGTSQAATKESPAGSNTYTLASTTVTRTAGARNFTADDVGKLIRSANSREALITNYTDATHVTVAGVGLNALVNFTNQNVDFYSAHFTGLTNEAFVTASAETVTKTEGDATVTATGSVFASTDVGRAIFVGGDIADPYAVRFEIATYVSATEITVTSLEGEFTARRVFVYTPQPTDTALTPVSRTSVCSIISGENSYTDDLAGAGIGERTYKRTFIFSPELEYIEYTSADDSGTFTWAATGVTRTAGSRNFTTADVGKYIEFDNGEFCKIVTRTSNTVVVVDRSPDATITDGIVDAIYGGRSYDGIGFSDLDDPDTNANIVIRLENAGVAEPVFALGPNPEFPGQQLKVTYTCIAAVAPAAITARANANITDSANVMGSNKFGTSVIEALALSTIDAAGDTETDFDVLEPAKPGTLALSPSLAALVALGGPDRSTGAIAVPIELGEYTEGEFSRLYEGTFGISDAVAPNWRTLGIYDQDAGAFAFSWLFEANQAKTGEVIITIRFRKSWNRDLS